MADDTMDAPGANRTVTAFFDTRDHAEQARTDLMAVGLPSDAITIVGSNAEQFTVAQDRHQGFWQSLVNFVMPDDDARVYDEGLRRGGFALSVSVTDSNHDQAIDVLDRDGAVDLDERETEWRSEGWGTSAGPADATPYAPASAGTAGFGGSYAGEDGIARDTAGPGFGGTPATQDGVARVTEAENPDVRERIGVGSASQTSPAPATGGAETYNHAASTRTDAASDAVTGKSPQTDLIGRRDAGNTRSRVRSYIVEGTTPR